MVRETNAPSTLAKIAEAYQNNPVVRALIQLAMAPIPYGIGSAVDAALTAAVENMRSERLRVFFDELASGSTSLTEERIQKQDFLHAYFCTLKAAMNTRRAEKIRLFARLLSNATLLDQIGTDTFEEYLHILDELSTREMRLLVLLKKIEDDHPPQLIMEGKEPKIENDLQRANRLWPQFEVAAEEELQIDRNQLGSILTRLNRTGFFETFVGAYLGYSGGRGKTTPFFSQFLAWIQNREEDIGNEIRRVDI